MQARVRRVGTPNRSTACNWCVPACLPMADVLRKARLKQKKGKGMYQGKRERKSFFPFLGLLTSHGFFSTGLTCCCHGRAIARECRPAPRLSKRPLCREEKIIYKTFFFFVYILICIIIYFPSFFLIHILVVRRLPHIKQWFQWLHDG